ncbi:hypothetical protein GCM10028812_44280 [Ancylobacter sonchi]
MFDVGSLAEQGGTAFSAEFEAFQLADMVVTDANLGDGATSEGQRKLVVKASATSC